MGANPHLLGGQGGSMIVVDDGALAHGWLRQTGVGVDAEVITIVATDGDTGEVTTRVYEADTAAVPAITAGNVRIDLNTGGTGIANVLTEIVDSVNNDGRRVCDAVEIGGNSVSFIALDPNVSIAWTTDFSNTTLSAAAFVGNIAPVPRTKSWGRHEITAADVATLVVAAGTNEIEIGGVNSDQATAPVLTRMMRHSATAGGIMSPVALDHRFVRVNGARWVLLIADIIPLVATDILSWECESPVEA